jgi:hypothetical protein
MQVASVALDWASIIIALIMLWLLPHKWLRWVALLTVGGCAVSLYLHYRLGYDWTLLGKIAANAVVPLIMAWLGNHLAVEVKESNRERALWRAGFALLAVCGIIGSFLVESALDGEHKKEVNDLKGRLTQAIEIFGHSTSSAEHVQIMATLDGMKPKNTTLPAKPVQKPQQGLFQQTPYSKWSRNALREYTLSFASRLRDYEQNFTNQQAAMLSRHQQNSIDHASDPRSQQDSLWRSQIQDELELYRNYEDGYKRNLFPTAENLRDELCDRLGVSAAVQQPSALQYGGSTAGAYPLSELALYLERLAQHLPT